MNIQGQLISLRAVEPGDIDQMYAWENDTHLWQISGSTTPFSHHTLALFVEQQQFDIYQTRQLRLMIITREGRSVGALDIFEFDPQNRRAGVGILIYDNDQRGQGYAADAVATVCQYARTTLGLHQLWCNVGADNSASRALFRSAGFTEVGCKRAWQWTSDGFRDEILMQKII